MQLSYDELDISHKDLEKQHAATRSNLLAAETLI